RLHSDERKSALASQNDSVCFRACFGKSHRSHGPRTLELYRSSRSPPASARLLVIGGVFVALALTGCAQGSTGQAGTPYAPSPPEDQAIRPEHGGGDGGGGGGMSRPWDGAKARGTKAAPPARP